MKVILFLLFFISTQVQANTFKQCLLNILSEEVNKIKSTSETLKFGKRKFSSDFKELKKKSLLTYLKNSDGYVEQNGKLTLVARKKISPDQYIYRDINNANYLVTREKARRFTRLHDSNGDEVFHTSEENSNGVITRYNRTTSENDKYLLKSSKLADRELSKKLANFHNLLLSTEKKDKNNLKEFLQDKDFMTLLDDGVTFDVYGSRYHLRRVTQDGKEYFLNSAISKSSVEITDDTGSSMVLTDKQWIKHLKDIDKTNENTSDLINSKQALSNINDVKKKNNAWNLSPLTIALKAGKLHMYPTTLIWGLGKAALNGSRHGGKEAIIRIPFEFIKNNGAYIAGYLILNKVGKNYVYNFTTDAEIGYKGEIEAKEYVNRAEQIKESGENILYIDAFEPNDHVKQSAINEFKYRYENSPNAKFVEVNDFNDMLTKIGNKCEEIKKEGKQLDRMIINGHGLVEKTGIRFNMHGISDIVQSINQLRIGTNNVRITNIKNSNKVRGCFKEGAVIELGSCAPAQGELGTVLLNEIGNFFLDKGGIVIGSTKVISVNEFMSESSFVGEFIDDFVWDQGILMPFRTFGAIIKHFGNNDEYEPYVKHVEIKPTQ